MILPSRHFPLFIVAFPSYLDYTIFVKKTKIIRKVCKNSLPV
ncbi:hypothetical protein BSM4216_2910 [Bacillus smithii]|nr:hypothetical protein BSM4216_2910 [Bacillus smithii]